MRYTVCFLLSKNRDYCSFWDYMMQWEFTCSVTVAYAPEELQRHETASVTSFASLTPRGVKGKSSCVW